MEDESEDKGAEADDEKEEEDGVDPLDAFMKGVTDEVQKIKAGDRERLGLRGGIVKAPATQPKSEPSEVRILLKQNGFSSCDARITKSCLPVPYSFLAV